MNFFGFGPSAEVEILLDGQDNRKTAEIKTEDGKKERHLLYYDGESVSGKVNIQLKKPGSRLDHYGIKVELIGQVELYYDRGNHHDFLNLVKELARPGDLFQHTSYNFEFVNVEKPYESYTGSNVKLRYFLRVTIVRRLSDIVKERELIVHTLSAYPEMNCSIKMEVGIEDCLHIEFEYNKSKYHLKDVIVGKIYFLLVRIKIKHMEIAIIKRETTGTGPNTFNENETIAKYEIMDGAPVRGESIPIRVFLAGYDLTPTMKDINKKFSVRYYLNLVLVDEEDRRYFKQQEIVLWRKGEKTRKPFQASLQQQWAQMQNPNVQFASSEQSLKGSSDTTSAHKDHHSNHKSSARSPLEDSSSSEQPTPDKEFRSVINSADVNSPVTSPLTEENPSLPPPPTQQSPPSNHDATKNNDDLEEDDESINLDRSPSPTLLDEDKDHDDDHHNLQEDGEQSTVKTVTTEEEAVEKEVEKVEEQPKEQSGPPNSRRSKKNRKSSKSTPPPVPVAEGAD